jgi:hypothetical protein
MKTTIVSVFVALLIATTASSVQAHNTRSYSAPTQLSDCDGLRGRAWGSCWHKVPVDSE